VTLLTVVAIALTVVVAAVTIGNFTGDVVTIGGMGTGTINYSTDGTDWSTTLETSGPSASWYARLDIDAGSFNGPVEITWQLQQNTGSWTDVGIAQTTQRTLSGDAETVYVSSNGDITVIEDSYDWSTDVTIAGSYRVIVAVEST
jgi:hypothetical protein